MKRTKVLGGITATELDCVIGKELVAFIVISLEKAIWDEAFGDKFTDEAVAVVVASNDAAVNVCDSPNFEVCVTTTLWLEADDFILDEILVRAIDSLDLLILDEGVADTFTDASTV